MNGSQIIGSKGGGGGSSFVTRPDTLRSNDSFEIILGMGSGRWKGLTYGMKGLRINGVPLENDDGSSNFQDVRVIFADGNPLENQPVKFNLGGGGNVQSVNVPLTNPNAPGTPGPWVSGAVNTEKADFIDLRFVVQQLFYQDAKGIRENTANIEIEMRPSNSATWTNIFLAPTSNSLSYDPMGYNYIPTFGSTYRIYLPEEIFEPGGTGFVASRTPNLVIGGKTTSAFVKELRIAVPNQGSYANVGWEVRARLLDKDSVDEDPVVERRIISFESITGVVTTPIGGTPAWEGQVWMQIIGKATDQFNGFPEIESVCDTKICKTPPTSVWNPETRQYLGPTWAGNYEEHFTTDPAWQMKEFIEDPIHGVAGLYPGATLDKWDALEASKYYSELVSDGRGGLHPRFNMNLTINEPREVSEQLQFLAGSVNSYIEDVGNGVWRLKVDKPETPKILFTRDNIFGEFSYSHTDVDTRFNDWRGTFLNEDFDYSEDTVRITDPEDIAVNGTRFTEIALVGCTNRQEALRRLMFRLRVSLNEFRIVNFVTNRIGRYLNPLDTILVADDALSSDLLTLSTSRVDRYEGNKVWLKRPVRLEVGISYNVVFTTDEKETIIRSVTNSASERGEVVGISLDSPLPNNIMAESAISLHAEGLASNPLSYRVLSIEKSEESEDEYAIVASFIDSGKWNAMDNVSEDEISLTSVPPYIDPPGAPADGIFSIKEFSTDSANKLVLSVNWDRPAGLFLSHYKVEYSLNNGSKIVLNNELSDSYTELENPQDGIYTFFITAYDRRGVHSRPLVAQYSLDGLDLPRQKIDWEDVTDDTGTRPEDSADVSVFGSGPASVSFNYQSNGTVEAGQLPRGLVYRFNDLSGPINTGITWTYVVMSGSVNGHTANPAISYPMSGTGAGTLEVTSLGSNSASIIVQGTQGSKTVSIQTVLTKTFLAPPPPSTAVASASQSSGYESFDSSTFTVISRVLQITPVGTTLNFSANLQASYNLQGSGTVEVLVKYYNGSAWAQMGDVEVGYPYKELSNNGGGGVSVRYEDEVIDSPAYFNFYRTQSVTAGVPVEVRVEARISSGSMNTINVGGFIEING